MDIQELAVNWKIKNQMKNILLASLLLCAVNLNAQHWLPVKNGVNFFPYTLFHDTIANLLYTAGSDPNYNETKSWDGLNFSTIENGVSGEVYSIVRYKDDIYFGGEIRKAYFDDNNISVSSIVRWNGNSWNDVGGGLAKSNIGQWISTMEVFNDELYVGGIFNKAGNVEANSIARWNGNSWQNVGDGLVNTEGMSGMVRCMTKFNNELYVAGSFTKAGNISTKNVAKWDGNSWHSLSNGVDLTINTMIFFNNELYVCGVKDANIMQLMKWNGTIWESVTMNGLDTSNLNVYNFNVYDFEIYENELYIGGKFHVGNDSKNIAKFDGTKWIPVTSLGVYENADFAGTVYCMSVFDSSLYLGGYFKNAEDVEVNNITRYTDKKPKASFSLSDSNLCMGHPWTTMINTSYNAPIDFEWFIPKASPNYSNMVAPIVTFPEPGEYKITFKVSNANGTDSSSQIITIHDSPENPVITIISDSVLISSYAENNQWYWNGKPLAGETNDTLIFNLDVLGHGYIYVEYADSIGCTSESSIIVSTKEIEKSERIKIFPNPFSNNLYIELFANNKITLEIFNLTGNSVLKREMTYSGFIDLTFLPCDIYCLKITGDNLYETKKIIKINK